MLNRLFYFLKILFFYFSSIQVSHAFSFNNSVGAAFLTDIVPIKIADNCNNLAISNSELVSITEEAIDRFWNTVPSSKLTLKVSGLVSVNDLFYTEELCTQSGNNCEPNTDLIVSDGILISCNNNTADNFKSSSILGITLPNNIQGSVLQGSLFLINDSPSNSFQNKSRRQMVAIIAHELGHAIGLGHSPVEDSLMYFTIIPIREKLGFDDIDGVSYLYPKEQPLSCGTISKQIPPQKHVLSFFFFFLLSFIMISLSRKKGLSSLLHFKAIFSAISIRK